MLDYSYDVITRYRNGTTSVDATIPVFKGSPKAEDLK
jgi:hypothetical protein